MKGFLLGLIVAALAFAGYHVWSSRRQPEPTARAPMTGAVAGAPRAKVKRRRGRGAARVALERGGGASAAPAEAAPAEPPAPKLTAADLRLVGQGDDLSRPDVVHLDLGEEGGARELTQEDIDDKFRAQESAILDCISEARPDPESFIPGRVTVKFRIQRTGQVRGVRVEAPAILQKGGLFGCIKGVVGKLRFPVSGGSQVVTYPFTLS